MDPIENHDNMPKQGLGLAVRGLTEHLDIIKKRKAQMAEFRAEDQEDKKWLEEIGTLIESLKKAL